jgi:hypothetical protein
LRKIRRKTQQRKWYDRRQEVGDRRSFSKSTGGFN